jgi:hypothetical protein
MLMAGKIYKNSFKLNAAQTGALVGTNPFDASVPAYQAWIDGFNNTFA